MTDIRIRDIVLEELSEIRKSMWDDAKQFLEDRTTIEAPFLNDRDELIYKDMVRRVRDVGYTIDHLKHYYEVRK